MLTTVCKRWWVLLLRGLAAIASGDLRDRVAWDHAHVAGILCSPRLRSSTASRQSFWAFAARPTARCGGRWSCSALLAIAAGIIAIAWPGMTFLVLATIIGSLCNRPRACLKSTPQSRCGKSSTTSGSWDCRGSCRFIFGGLILFRPGAGLLAITLLDRRVHARDGCFRNCAVAAAAHDGAELGELAHSRQP